MRRKTGPQLVDSDVVVGEPAASAPHDSISLAGWPHLIRTVSSDLEASELARRVCRDVVEQFGFSRALIATVDVKHDCLVGRAGYDPHIPASLYLALLRLYRIPLAPVPDGRLLIAAWCVKNCEQAYVPDARYDSFRPDEATQRVFVIKALGTSEYAVTPLVYQGRPVGVLAVDKKGQADHITPGELALLRDVAALLALRLGPLLQSENDGDVRGRAANADEESLRVPLGHAEEGAHSARTQLLQSVLHDLKAPTQSIVGFAELLQLGRVGPLTAEQAEFVERIVSGGEELAEVVDRVLTMLELDAAPSNNVPENVTACSVVAAVLERLRGKALRADVGLISQVCEDMPPLAGDWHRLGAVFQNLIANAIDAASPSDAVRVIGTPHSDPRFASFAVVHESSGGAEPAAPPFDPEWSKGAGRRRSHGLGLAIVRRIVDGYGGDVWAEGEPNRTFTIRFTLPFAGPQTADGPQLIIRA